MWCCCGICLTNDEPRRVKSRATFLLDGEDLPASFKLEYQPFVCLIVETLETVKTTIDTL
jgi:hypothetical protein